MVLATDMYSVTADIMWDAYSQMTWYRNSSHQLTVYLAFHVKTV